MPFFIIDETAQDNSNVIDLLDDFYPYVKDRLKFDVDAKIKLRSDLENSKNSLGRTAYYDPNLHEVVIYVDGRHAKDILRSVSHELVHHAQNCRGDFDHQFKTVDGYAQKNPHLRKMEMEAYLLGSGIYFRDWEDGYKMGVRIMNEWKEEKKKKILLSEHKEKKEKEKKEKSTFEKFVAGAKEGKFGKKAKEDMEKGGYKRDLEEDVAEKDISHFCATHVKENSTGREGEVISHSLLEDGAVDFYSVDFGGEIVEDIHVSELDILEGQGHAHPKRDLTPKQKKAKEKLAAKAGDPDEVEKEDFEALKEKKSLKEHYNSRGEHIYKKLMKRWIKK